MAVSINTKLGASGSSATLGAVIAAGGKASSKILSNVLYKALAGYLNVPVNTGATPYSQLMQTVLEGDFDSVRIGVLHASANAAAGVKVQICCGSTLSTGNPATATPATIAGAIAMNTGTGDAIGRVLGWRVATWGGAATGTLAAAPLNATGSGSTNSGGTECTITWTDPIVAPSVPRADGTSGLPVLYVNLVYPAGVDRTSINMETFVGSGIAGGASWALEGNSTTAPYNRPVRVVTNPTNDAVTTPGYNYSSGAVMEYKEWPPIVIEYTLRNGMGYTLLVFGDSLDEGAKATPVKCCWMAEAQNLISTAKVPFSYANLAVGGSTMDEWIRRANKLFPSFGPVNVYIRGCSPNSLGGPITAVNIANAHASFGKLRQIVNKAGVCFFTGTIIPTNSLGSGAKNYGPSDITYRLPYNDGLRTSTFNLVDTDKLVTTATVDANGQYNIRPEYADVDGIHMNQAGYKVQGTAFVPVWNAA